MSQTPSNAGGNSGNQGDAFFASTFTGPTPAPNIQGVQQRAPLPPPPKLAPLSAHAREFPKHMAARYADARLKAWAWLDGLKIEPLELWRSGIAGRKKLAEALDAYLAISHNATAEEKARIRSRVEALAATTKSDTYHDLLGMSVKEFQADSLSYLRVAVLLKELGVSVAEYVGKIFISRQRLDSDVSARGTWQQVAQARYYEMLGLEGVNWPVMDAVDKWTVKTRTAPALGSDPRQYYNFCHEIFISYDYGMAMDTLLLFPDDRVYAAEQLLGYLDWAVRRKFADLAAECISALSYVGAGGDPTTMRGVEFLLDVQNADGTWGDYKMIEARSPNPAVHFYLHSVIVALRANVDVMRRLPG